MKKLTKRRAKTIWKRACRHYGAKTIRPSAWTQKVLNWFGKSPVPDIKLMLVQMGVEKVDQFLRERFMYVEIGDTKYVCIPNVLLSTKDRSLFGWLCAEGEELEHCENCKDDGGWIKFYSNYFIKKGGRAVIEARGKAAQEDVARALGRQHVTPAPRVFTEAWRKAYKLRHIDVDTAMAVYTKLIYKIEIGQHATSAGSVMDQIIQDVLG